MTVSKDDCVAALRANSRNDSIGAVGNLFNGFAVWASSIPDRPLRFCFANRGGRETFVVAVVPLVEVIFENCLFA